MAFKVGQQCSQDSHGHREEPITIDDMAAAIFVEDLQRALSAIGCTPRCIEDAGICVPFDAAHDYVTTGPCFDGDSDDADEIPSRIEVMFDGENDTIMSSRESIGPGSTYESFRSIEATTRVRNFAQHACLSKCLQPEK